VHLPVDCTGIRVEGEGEWNAGKHGGSRRRVWRKVHIGIDKRSLEIRAAAFTTGEVEDAPVLPGLLDQIPPDREIAGVTAEGAFDTRKAHEALPLAVPRSFSLARTPSHGRLSPPGGVARNEALRASKRFGRTVWRRWGGSCRRSLAATRIHCARLPGQSLPARDFDRRVAAFRVRGAALDGFTTRGRPLRKSQGKSARKTGRPLRTRSMQRSHT